MRWPSKSLCDPRIRISDKGRWGNSATLDSHLQIPSIFSCNSISSKQSQITTSKLKLVDDLSHLPKFCVSLHSLSCKLVFYVTPDSGCQCSLIRSNVGQGSLLGHLWSGWPPAPPAPPTSQPLHGPLVIARQNGSLFCFSPCLLLHGCLKTPHIQIIS